MIKQETLGVEYFQFPRLTQFSRLCHGIFTRQGGVSREPFESLNVGLNVGDRPDFVDTNRSIISRCLNGLDLVFANQVHGTDIWQLESESSGTDHGGREPVTADAVITNRRNVLIGIQVADCQAVVLYDPTHEVVANVHSGWRGSVANILGKTVHCMVTHYGANPEHMLAGIGPSLGPCCSEFINYRTEIPEQLWKFRISETYFDFWAISKFQLMASGLKSHHIYCARLCTKCRTDLFYSYRAQKQTGRFAVVIGLT